MKRNDALKQALKRHGVSDASEYLSKKGDDAKIVRSTDPDIRMRGGVHLMKGRKTNRRRINEGMERLKYL